MKKSQQKVNSNPSQNHNNNPVNNIPQQQLIQIKSSFDLFDTDHSGSIDTKQLKQAMISLGFQQKNQSIFQMIAQLDSDGNSIITFDEWVVLMTAKSSQNSSREHYNKIFKLFDNESCGYICCNRLVEVAKQLGEDVEYAEIVEMLKRADLDIDGLISQEQLYTVMTKTHAK